MRKEIQIRTNLSKNIFLFIVLFTDVKHSTLIEDIIVCKSQKYYIVNHNNLKFKNYCYSIADNIIIISLSLPII